MNTPRRRLKGASASQLTEEVIQKVGMHLRRRTGSIGDLTGTDASGFGVLHIDIEFPLAAWEWGTEKITVYVETHRKETDAA